MTNGSKKTKENGWYDCNICQGRGYLEVYSPDNLDAPPVSMICNACEDGKVRHDNYSDNTRE